MKKIFAITLALTFCAGMIHAQNGKFSVGIAGGYEQNGFFNKTTSSSSLFEYYQLGVFGEYRFDGNWGVKAEFSTSMQYKTTLNETSIHESLPSLQVFVGAVREWRWGNLFLDLTFGPGYRHANLKSIDGNGYAISNAVFIGVEPAIGWRFNDHWSVRLQNRWDFNIYESYYEIIRKPQGATFNGGFNATLAVAYTF